MTPHGHVAISCIDLRKQFVLRHTRLRPVHGLEEVRLHLADEVLPL